MKLSTKGRYGLKAMFELSISSMNGPVSIKQIAKNQNISEQYLEQLFRTLRKKGFIKSIRGAQGGYLLAKDPIDITVGDILIALEGPVSLSACIIDEDACKNSNTCVTKAVWEKVKKGIEDVINDINLQDMINDYNKNNIDLTNILEIGDN
ncbi:MAG: Rrf2 family transcriptional regulator [Peptostreptococcaceae bacterium]